MTQVLTYFRTQKHFTPITLLLHTCCVLQAFHLCTIYFSSSNKLSSPPFHHSPITALSTLFVPNHTIDYKINTLFPPIL